MKIFISRSKGDATPFFDPKALSEFIETKGGEKLIRMPISDFLSSARRIQGGELHVDKMSGVRNLISNSTKFNSIPFLRTQGVAGKNWFQVTGHEGRHRAMALLAMGYSIMPVRIISNTVIWSHQLNPSNFEYLQDWPSKLRGEHGNLVPFPFTREQAPKDFE